jgi:hypothetical protein
MNFQDMLLEELSSAALSSAALLLVHQWYTRHFDIFRYNKQNKLHHILLPHQCMFFHMLYT